MVPNAVYCVEMFWYTGNIRIWHTDRSYMKLIEKKSPWNKEWDILKKRETRFLKKQMEVRSSYLNQKLEKIVPPKLQETLDLAFYKAFQTVFEKGTKFIEKTYNKEQHQNTFKINAYAAELKESGKSVKAFSRQAGTTKRKNLLVSGAEGVGLGILGIGIPDIPIFTGVLLKSIYEIAMSYGFAYESEEEKLFLLKLIGISMEHGEALVKGNEELNQGITSGNLCGEPKADLLKKTAQTLSAELLYMKFLQGIPIVGVVGGLYDSICLNKITEYADIKYKRRFLTGPKKF